MTREELSQAIIERGVSSGIKMANCPLEMDKENAFCTLPHRVREYVLNFHENGFPYRAPTFWTSYDWPEERDLERILEERGAETIEKLDEAAISSIVEEYAQYIAGVILFDALESRSDRKWSLSSLEFVDAE